MATIYRRKVRNGYSYEVKIRRAGIKPILKTFLTRTEAKRWSRSMETKLDKGDYSDYSTASKVTLGDLFKRYISENKHKKKKQWKNEEYRCSQLLADELSNVNLLRFSTKHLAEYRDRRLEEVQGPTFNKDFNFISVVIQTALTEWEIYLPNNPCKIFKREPENQPRDRVLTFHEEERLLQGCQEHTNIYLKPAVAFSLETSIRKGELLGINRKHINWEARTLTLYDTKNGEDRIIPLSEHAFHILATLPRQLNGTMFPFTADSLDKHFYRVRDKIGLVDFRWHDLRRSAISNMFQIRNYDLPTVQLLSGHKQPSVLLKVYTKLDPEQVARKLG